ncbi:MAG: DNA translocase FtsK 4TM domain-containing protein, partial [Polyangiaceae bacterium]
MSVPLFAPRRPAPSVLGGDPDAFARGREALALVLWTFALFSCLALGSYETGDAGSSVGANWVGPVGEACAHAVVSALGIVAWAIPLEAVLLGFPYVRGKRSLVTSHRVAGDLLVLLIAASLVQVGFPTRPAFGHMSSSGAVGELFGELSRSLFSTIGSFIVGFACLGLVLIGRASFSFIALMRWFGRLGEKSAEKTAHGATKVAVAWKKARDLERDKKEAERRAALPHIASEMADDATIAVERPSDPPPVMELEAGIEEAIADVARENDIDPAPKKRTRKPREQKEKVEAAAAPITDDPPLAAIVLDQPIEPPKTKKQKEKLMPTIVDTSAALEKEKISKKEEAAAKIEAKRNTYNYKLPSIHFLIPQKIDPTLAVDRETLL